MKMAVEVVRSKEMVYKVASKLYCVLRSTLKDFIKKSSDKCSKNLIEMRFNQKTVFLLELENLC